MLPFIKKYKWILLAVVAVAIVLTIAFVSGGKLTQQPPAATAPVTTASTAATVDTAAVISSAPVSSASTTAASTTAAATSGTQPSAATSVRATVSATTAVPAATTPVSAAQDPYQTASVPADKPQPAEPQTQEIKEEKHKCTLSVSCAAAWERREEWDTAVAEELPENGIILASEQVSFNEGESVFDVLKRVCKSRAVPMEFTATPLYNTAYIEGIGNLYEFDCGSGSGWMYKVNGWFPNYGCSRYAVQDGDVIEWLYTCNLGRDIGGENIKYTD